ncbi:MAG TPA: serine hydrolase domain-containing protein [Thermoanaerobaculia bacterium]|jgi:CubicO group peptidase (beta-lactamase class C family)
MKNASIRAFFTAITFLFSMQVQAQTPAMRERIDGFVRALNGTAEEFDKYAEEAYSAAMLADDTPAKRRELLKRLQSEFGRIEIRGVRREGEQRVGIDVTGSTGMRGSFVIDHEPAEPHKITNILLRIGEPGAGPGAGGPGPRSGPGGPGPGAVALAPVPVHAGMSAAELSTALDTYLTRMSTEDKFAGTVLVARDGQPVFEKSYGLANRSDNVPNTPRTRFNLGSINKHFTRIAIAQLAAAGKVSASDAIAKYLPDYPNANARNITVQQLLDMTAGLADFFGPEFDASPKHKFQRNRDYYQFVAPKPLNFEPGSRKEYCNSCYIVLGEIVERVAGMPYEQYVTDNVFRRAGMQGAAFLSSDEIAPNVALGYTRRGGPLRSNVLKHGAGGSGAGGGYATARDLLALDEAVRRAVVLDDARLSAFFKLGDEVNGRASGESGYAGGSLGINAAVIAGPVWTVIALANIDPPAADALAPAIYRSLADAK